jgi:hypothetical protein
LLDELVVRGAQPPVEQAGLAQQEGAGANARHLGLHAVFQKLFSQPVGADLNLSHRAD